MVISSELFFSFTILKVATVTKKEVKDMKIKLTIALTSALLMSSSAQAGSWNADLFLGNQQSDNLGWAGGNYNTDSGQSYGLGISKQVSPRLGLGFEVGFTKNEYSNFKPNYISGRSMMFTAEYDFMQRGRSSIYGGIGLGVIKAEYKNTGFSHTHSDSVTGGRLSLGTRYALSPRTKIFLEARHIGTFKDPKIAHNGGAGPLVGADYEGNSLVLGLRYSFK